tara:strand:- start:502 stop:717 length:216 start_codon:yes stop_codon:yes gene_type:complete
MIENVGKILKGVFFIMVAFAIFGVGVSAGFFAIGPGDLVGGGITGAVTADSCPVYECKLTENKCELVKTEK